MVPAADMMNPRKEIAHAIFEDTKSWQTLIHKTTRAGATTSLLAESMNRNEKFLAIVPTNRIATKTIISEAKMFTELENAEIIHVPANHKCLLNQELIEDYPDLEFLPILPLAASCEKCDRYSECPVTAVLRKPESNGIVLTYSKIVALMLAAKARPNAFAGRVIEEIRKANNILLDEIHELQFGKITGLTVYNNVTGHLGIEKYIPILRDFEYLRRVISSFALVLSDKDIKNAIFEIHNETENEDFFRHHIRKTFPNPAPGIVEQEKEVNVIVGTYHEIIELTKIRDQYDLSMPDILDLYKILSIILNPKIAIHGIREDGIIKVQLSVVDQAFSKLLASFVMSMQKENNRIFLTSATIGSFDYGTFFKAGMRPRKVMFGDNGDPLNTNSKMLILADSKKYHYQGKNSLYNKIQEIVSRTKSILEAYGKDNCLIVTLNKKKALMLEIALKGIGIEHKVEYYKSPKLMGVSAKERVMIAVGTAKKPANSYDVITNSAEESKRMLEEAVQFDTWQAWSRVKDPEGKENSLVFALGCSVEECENLTTYGFNRNVEIEPYERNQKKRVKVLIEENEISKPAIKKCLSFSDMLKEAFVHKQSKNCDYFSDNFLFSNNYRTFTQFSSQFLDSPLKLLQRIVNRHDCYGLHAFSKNKWGFPKQTDNVSDTRLEQHLRGEITIGTYHVGLDNTVKTICYDIDAHTKDTDTEEQIQAIYDEAERKRERLSNFLNLIKVPFILESSGSPHGYHFWILVEPVHASIAKYFAEQLLKEAGFKKGEMEVYPKQGKLWSKSEYGNLIKLPFAFHRKHENWSKILINGEWISDFKNLEVGILDLSGVEIPVKEPKPQAAAKCKNAFGPELSIPVPKKTEIRPCIAAAINKQLGNQMRLFVTREYFNAGMQDPKQLAALFKNQSDYNDKESLSHVESIIKVKNIYIPCKTFRKQAAQYVDCSVCRYRQSFMQKVEINKNPPSSKQPDYSESIT